MRSLRLVAATFAVCLAAAGSDRAAAAVSAPGQLVAVDSTGRILGRIDHLRGTEAYLSFAAGDQVLLAKITASGLGPDDANAGTIYFANAGCTGSMYLPNVTGRVVLPAAMYIDSGAQTATLFVPDTSTGPSFNNAASRYVAPTGCTTYCCNVFSFPVVAVATLPYFPPFSIRPAAGDQTAFTALPACRIVDTRLAGGPFAAGETRTYDAIAGDYTAQGGAAAGCGLPPYRGDTPQVQSVLINVVAVDPAGQGWLRGGPGGGALPFGVILNFSTSSIGNAVAVALAQDTVPGQDLEIGAFKNTTHVVIDVLGYYSGAAPGAP